MNNNLYSEIGEGLPFLKMAFEGNTGSGKSYTCALTCIGVHQRIKSTKPVIIFDTENKSVFLKPLFDAAKVPVVAVKRKSVTDLQKVMRDCAEGKSDILMIDSLTDVNKEYIEAWLRKNDESYLEFQHYGKLNPLWEKDFAVPYSEAQFHCLYTGREAFDYDQWKDEKGKWQIEKTGTKLKLRAAGDSHYYCDVAVRMTQKRNVLRRLLRKDEPRIWNEALIVKARDIRYRGVSFVDPTFKNFEPILAFLLDQVKPTSAVKGDSDEDLFPDQKEGSPDYYKRKEYRERIDADLALVTDADGQASKIGVMKKAFCEETSDTAIAVMNVEQLRSAHEIVQDFAKIIRRISNGEKQVFVGKSGAETDRIIAKNRLDHLGTETLGEADKTHLLEYLDQLVKTFERQKPSGQETPAHKGN